MCIDSKILKVTRLGEILESLHILKSQPKLNDSNSSFPLNIVH